MAYYLIATWHADDGVYAPQFGGRDRECVAEERRDQYVKQPGYAYPGDGKFASRDVIIVTFKRVPSAAAIRERLASLSATRSMKG